MNTAEICHLTPTAVARLVKAHLPDNPKPGPHGRRGNTRWPFPGTVELWLNGDQGEEELSLATCQDLGHGGVGVLCDEWLSPGTELAIAIHQPSRSLHGRAVVRHCTKINHGFYVGLEFLFDRRGH